MRMFRTVVGMALLAGGCGDEGGDFDSATCGLDLTTAGGVTARFDHDVGVACLTQRSGGSGGVSGSFIAIDHPSGIESVEIELPTLMRGMIGASTGDVVLRTGAEVWRVDGCDALVHEHRETGPAELGTYYRVHATLTCAAPADPDTAGGPATTIGGLELIYTIAWQ
jgi:hypothetical protein